MKDKNGTKIKKGDYIKRCGFVTYADGPKYKVSKKTWVVTKNEQGELVLPSAAEGIEYLVVGSEKKGFNPEYLPVSDVVDVSQGSVPQKYRALKDVGSQNWKKGEVVQITGKVSNGTLERGVLELVPDTTPHQHILMVVDPVLMKPAVNEL